MSWFSKPPFSISSSFVEKYTATCFCKRVRFAVSTDPVTSKICDCSQCQHLHGAPSQWAALFHKTAVQFSPSSEQHLRFYNTEHDTVFEDGQERVLPCKIQCNHCGSWVADEGRTMFMAFPTLFNFGDSDTCPNIPSSFLPKCHIFCGSKCLDSNDGLPHFLDDRKTPLSVGDFLVHVAPALDGSGHKGQAGRVVVLGGSVDYAGAPFYAGMAALRVVPDHYFVCTLDA